MGMWFFYMMMRLNLCEKINPTTHVFLTICVYGKLLTEKSFVGDFCIKKINKAIKNFDENALPVD